jgi:hypothetical protein
MKRFCGACLVTVLLLFQPTATFAQNTSALINEALDKLVKLDLDTTLPIAMRAIGEQTGVTIEAAPAVWDLLPWGEQTQIKAKIEGQTLREALDAITRKLGLRFALKEHVVQLQPMPALMRVGRRSTVSELQALDLLASTPMELGTDKPMVGQLLEAVDAKLQSIDEQRKTQHLQPYGFAIENRAGAAARSDQQIFVPRNATMMDALESLVQETRATWYPWGKSIVIVPKEDQVRTQLAKTITIRFNGVDVQQVLAELSQRAGVDFSMEPGAIQRIAPEFRTVRLNLVDAPIKQALDSLTGFTGLAYAVREDGVYIWNPSSTATTPARDPTVGLIQLDNGMQVLVKESQVPPDMTEYLRMKTQKKLDEIREMMREEGFKPTTQPAPATQPAEQDL